MFRLNSVPLPTLSQRSAMAAIHSIAAQSFLSLPNPKPRKRIAAHPKPILTSKLPKNPTFLRNKQKSRRVLNSAVKREECDVIPVQSSDSTDQQEGVVASRVESEAGDQGELVSQVGGFGASEGRLSFEGAGGFGSTGVGSERESEEFERPVENLLTNIPSRYSSASLNRSSASLNRSSFPSGFVFGSASASYQYEGAWNEGGKGPSIWDNFTHQYPEKISDGSNGDVANDQYHRYKEDVKIMKDMGLDAYRFSISWSRLLPNGKLSGGVSKEGVQYYNNLINELQNKGIAPYVTIFHWDLPQALEEEYGGFLNRQIVNHFLDYAELCFKLFGDRVKHWITLNEPYNFINFGYASGQLAPGRCSAWQDLNCTGGDSATEPYIVAHHFLLAHAHAVEVYKTKYQASQEGVIGITLAANWFVPVSNETRHQNAANRSLDFMFGWFMEPLTSGQYPHSMQVLVKERLPKFTEEESKLIKGSFDFVGMNYYTTHYSSDQPDNNSANPSFLTDACVFESTELNGVPIGPPAASSWLVVYPKGIREILLYAKHKYNNPVIYITENGMDEFDDPKLSLSQSLNDTHRIDYHYHHLDYLRKAIDDGVNVKGYFAWSLTDNFEWAAGYTLRFGLVYIDYNDGLKRHPKLSASWFKYFLG